MAYFINGFQFMFISFVLLLLIALGGAAITYLFAKSETFLWRLSAGSIVGSAVFGLSGFLLTFAMGLSRWTVFAALLITLAPLLLLKQRSVAAQFRYEKQLAKSRFQGTSFKKFFRFLYYFSIFILLWVFFEQAMRVNENGIFTGASQNLGDLPFHLGAIFSFTEGLNFPPQNPSFAGARFTYPFLADLITAFFVRSGANVENAMVVQNAFYGFSLVVLFERFVYGLTKNKLAGKLAPLLLIFSGGLGFIWFAKDLWESTKPFGEFLWNLPRDYTIGTNFRWGNSMIVLFITQRSLLLGMPLAIVVLTKLWQIFEGAKVDEFNDNNTADSANSAFLSSFSLSSFSVGILAGTLPLIHAHSLFVLFVVTACLFVFRPELWREWVAFGVGTALAALPLLGWLTAGSASHLSDFIGWHFGWDAGETNIFWFWIKNTGIFIPIVIAGIIWKFYDPKFGVEIKKVKKKKKGENRKEAETEETGIDTIPPLIYFYVPFFLLFIVSNTVKLAPWEWDNIKVLIYWFIGSIPFAALVLARLWVKETVFKVAAVLCLLVLAGAGSLDVWRVVSGEIDYKVFDKDAVEIARLIGIKTAPTALFLNAPTYNSAVVLTGRRSLMRYRGHLSSHGIDYREREEDLRRIYAGEGSTEILLKKHGIEYILLSPEVRSYASDPSRPFTLNETFLSKFPLVAESGEYKVYKVN